jgi:hypothetical protein
MRHTPGPWEIRDDNLGCKEIVAGFSNDSEGWDGRLFTVNVGYTHGLENEGEDAANARLIAAAPDMLAALRAVIFQTIQGKVLERDACVTAARSAIAKAEGRA